MQAALTMLLMAALLTLSACGDSSDYTTTAANGDLTALGDIHLCVREDGSGTRATFENLLGITTRLNGVDLYPTWENTEVYESSSELIAAVAADAGAIGYVSYGLISEEDGVDVIAVDSILCNDESIEAMEYPLSRYFYLSWIGEKDDLMTDFLSYLNSAGQEIVENDYVAVKKASTFLADRTVKKNGGTITIAGSSSVAPLMAELAEGYLACYSDSGESTLDGSGTAAGVTSTTSADGLTVTYSAGSITIEITTSDSGSGITDMLMGEYDFAMSSREFEDYEAELVTYQAIAKDGIAVIVQTGSPVKNLNLEQLADIFGRAITVWES